MTNMMNLRINHTFMSIPVINGVMKVEPKRAWTAGNPRLAPESGISTDTRWEYAAAQDADSFIAWLETNAGFFNGLAMSGGDTEVTSSSGAPFSAEQLKRLAAMHIRPGINPTGRRF